MSDLPELPPLPEDITELWNGDGATRDRLTVLTLSFARESMERGRRAGLEEAARVIACAQATLIEQRREFQRGEIPDLDELEDALAAIRSAGEK